MKAKGFWLLSLLISDGVYEIARKGSEKKRNTRYKRARIGLIEIEIACQTPIILTSCTFFGEDKRIRSGLLGIVSKADHDAFGCFIRGGLHVDRGFQIQPLNETQATEVVERRCGDDDAEGAARAEQLSSAMHEGVEGQGSGVPCLRALAVSPLSFGQLAVKMEQ